MEVYHDQRTPFFHIVWGVALGLFIGLWLFALTFGMFVLWRIDEGMKAVHTHAADRAPIDWHDYLSH